jgi:DNA-binding Lrp family transcriptional regulator
LAKRTGLSPSTVRRRLERLEANRFMALRCDVARFLSGWPVAVHMWGQVRPDRAADVVARIVGMREVRVCASLSGPHNLALSVWLRSMDDLPAFEASLATRTPDLTIADQAVTLWPLKLGGHILDPDGRHVRSVPMSLWSEQEAADAETAVVARLSRSGKA